MRKKKLVIISGPSCVGKTPMLMALNRVHPEIEYGRPILYNSRLPRPVETDGVDYHFRTEEEIRSLPSNRFIIGKARHIWQAIDLDEVERLFADLRLIVFEIYPTLGALFRECPRIQELASEFETRTVFLSPVSEEEIIEVQIASGFATPQEALTAIMTPKLVNRSIQQGKAITPAEMNDIRLRASRAYEEIQIGKEYTDFIVNHDSEDSINWKYTPPLGEAGRTLKQFVQILVE
jgi:guanylate kinase